jgi:ornithine carbamoyltransferase
MKDLISLADYTRQEIEVILDLADDLKRRQKNRAPHRILDGRTMAMVFEKPSLRTRVTFEAGMVQLGGYAIFLETSLGKRESVPDVARNLGRWVDVIVARTFRHSDVVALAEHAEVPVINALTDELHPCQILADVQTLREHRGKDLSGMRVAFVGDGNNVWASWVNFAAHFPIELVLVCPEGYEGDVQHVDQARARGAAVSITHDIEGASGADVIYTDVWTSMGQEEEALRRLQAFQPYQVNRDLMALAKPDALFMHCLPAKRGQEVTDEVIDGPNSVVFDEAENRLHAQKGVLAHLLGGR